MLIGRKSLFVKERFQFIRFSARYDIFDTETNEQVGFAREENSLGVNLSRFVMSKLNISNNIVVYDNETNLCEFVIRKPFSFLRSKVSIYDRDGNLLGYFISKLFTVGGFFVFDVKDQQIAEVIGDWKGWNFQIVDNEGMEIGTVTKKWAGIGREIFTTADNYLIKIDENYQLEDDLARLILAGCLAIDIVFKERG